MNEASPMATDRETLVEMSNPKYERQVDDEEGSGSSASPTDTPMGESNAHDGHTRFPTLHYKAGYAICGRFTRLEQFLGLLSIFLALLVIIFISILASRHDERAPSPRVVPPVTTPPATEDKCVTPACVTVASSVINAMDLSVDPCEDFYTYVCGGWIKKHPIPSGHSHWGTFGVLWQQNQLAMKNALDAQEKFDSLSEQKAKTYYQSCMDTNKTIEKLGSQPLLDLLHDLDLNNLTAQTDYNRVLNTVQAYNIDVLLAIWVGEDERNSQQNILQVDQSGLGLPDRDYYLNKTIEEDKVLGAYLEYMGELGSLLGWDKNDTLDMGRKIIEFETRLANITIPADERRDEEKNYHKMSLAELQQLAPVINWLGYFNTILKVSNITVTSSEKLVVYAPEFLGNMSALVLNMTSTEEGKMTLLHYMRWHIVKAFAPYLSKEFVTIEKNFAQALSGSSGREEVWRYCITDTNGKLGFALGALFVKSEFKGDNKEKLDVYIQAEQMIQEVRNAFKRNLLKLTWMDEETKKAAIDKADAIVDMIGFPSFILNKTALDERYAEFPVTVDGYFSNNINSVKYAVKRNIDKLKRKPDKNSWDMTPPTINAYYSPTKNEIVFPAGILQAPFYDQTFPKSLNYGAMGVVMGHELTHGFDDQGREFDKYGNLHPWWNNASVAKFKELTKCFIDQYSQYKLNGEKVNGKQTLGENIADNGGLKAAYHAYEHWVQHNGEEQPLPGTNLTHRQLFFVGFSQVWCSSQTKEEDKLQLATDPHSPGKYRVIGTLSNSVEFAQQFQCKPGSPMNPAVQKKCVIW
ncbi:endothelin-converting enzyme homolog isoform X3 [Lingula anatina]|uniref:Endothelin-converting enzyme homolog isoform X3 n=1 Tax=Lingula anatina TaxID=7574 RepID=A0A1S3HMH7_LINAN|nr:endothelin-converting enzyme homolog isoform X3 [Lingula anatina]|eukprot:XP_013387227.1 endothelin-converting enzyme homolog isoform X3 [Lingula anatina]